MSIVWSLDAWNDYLWWQEQDRKTLRRINALMRDILGHGNEGIGKPEPLRYERHGYWSRRITEEHRLVYRFTDDELFVASCRYHYER